MAADPQFATTPRIGMVVINTANTARDGSGTLGTVITGGTNGTRIDRVRFQANGASTAGQILRLFIHDGTNARLEREMMTAAVTPSATVPALGMDIVYGDSNPLVLPSGWSLRAAGHNADSYVVMAFGADF